MDFLRAALADAKSRTAKRKHEDASSSESQSATSTSTSTSTEEPGVKKFKTRGEIEAGRKAKLQAEKEERIKQRQALAEEKLAPVKSSSSLSASSSSSSFAPAPSSSHLERAPSLDEEHELISANEVKIKLRLAQQPITLFGETDQQRVARLKQYEMLVHEKQTGSTGRHNLMQDIQTEIEDELAKAMAEESEAAAAAAAGEGSAGSGSGSGSAPDSSVAPLDSADSQKQEQKNAKEKMYTQQMTRESFATPEDYVLHFFKRMLKEWELDLQNRSKEVKRSTRGKLELATQKQTRQYMKPLFKQLKAKKCDADVISQCEKIVTYCLNRNYKQADEEYLTLAIGNAPWPIGVTMVSIHERSGRENLNSHNQAHVLNDETQRKYIQSMKRLMTYCSHKYPRIMTSKADLLKQQALQEAEDEAFLQDAQQRQQQTGS